MIQERLTVAEYKNIILKEQSQIQNKNKYKNIRCSYEGYNFDSKKEMNRYIHLKLLVKLKVITELKLQVKFKLMDGVIYSVNKNSRKDVYYVADFTYTNLETNTLVVEDVKSPSTRKNSVYQLKKHLMKLNHGIEIIEI